MAFQGVLTEDVVEIGLCDDVVARALGVGLRASEKEVEESAAAGIGVTGAAERVSAVVVAVKGIRDVEAATVIAELEVMVADGFGGRCRRSGSWESMRGCGPLVLNPRLKKPAMLK